MRSKFLEKTKVRNEHDAMKSSIIAALQHNRTYQKEALDYERGRFRESLTHYLRKYAPDYSKSVPDKIHVETMSSVCEKISKQYGYILVNSRLRFGTVQKALNLYLKFLWCLDETRADPPHCPIDRIVLKKADLDGSWTKLDSPDIYMDWISKLKKFAKERGFESLQVWELSIWNEIA